MKSKTKASKIQKRKKLSKGRHVSSGRICLLGGVVLLLFLLSMGIRTAGTEGKKEVFAASEGSSSKTEGTVESVLPSGLAGVISGLREAPREGARVERIGTSCEEVIVGQRIATVNAVADQVNVSSSMENVVTTLENHSADVVQTPKLMSDYDYETLLALVEAEATGEDLKGKVLIANVIMNRVKSDQFPDNVWEVIWDNTGGMTQFSPTYDGRISTVVISDETREAVKQALNGVDYSQGALYFMAEAQSESENVDWFKNDLKFLFKHGNHDFYTIPDEKDTKKENSQKETVVLEEENTVEMVKNN